MKKILKNLFWFCLFIAGVFVSGVCVSLPLWFLATKLPEIYNVSFVIICIALLTFLIIRKFRKKHYSINSR